MRAREPLPVSSLLYTAQDLCVRLAELRKEVIQAKGHPDKSRVVNLDVQLPSSSTRSEYDKVLQRFLDVLQELIDHPNLLSHTHKPITHSLITFAEESGNYPASLYFPNDIKYDGSDLYVSTRHSDIYLGQWRDYYVAIKVPRRYASFDLSAFRKAFAREATLWVQLNHPNILSFLGTMMFGTQNQRPSIVTPWMVNGTLPDYLKKHTLANRRQLMLDIAWGIEYLHTHSPCIIHGDLKGINILVDENGKACLADLGHALSSWDSFWEQIGYDPGKEIKGTLWWQAPEVVNGDSGVTYASDMYAFSMVSYEIFADAIPFSNVREGQVIMGVLSGHQPPRPDEALSKRTGLDDFIWDIMERCWSESPASRLTALQVVTLLKSIPADVS